MDKLPCLFIEHLTEMACEQNGRIAYGMEFDPKYCDVTIKRWEEFTGKKAELILE